jgi:hypothetical protein
MRVIDMRFRTTVAAGVLLLFGAAGCADLDVTNPNAPDTEQALATPGDVESLISGAWVSWWRAQANQNGFALPAHTTALGHSAYPANFGMVEFSQIPRQAIVNDPADAFYGQFQYTYTNHYRAITATRDGLAALDADVSLGTNEPRARAFAHFVQGLAHGSLALLFDQAFVVDQNTPVTADGLPDVQPQSYQEVMDAAMGYFDQALAVIAQSPAFTLPESWMSTEVSSARLTQIIHSYKARFRASLARTPEDRAAVDWNAVLADIQAGITDNYNVAHDGFGTRFASHPNVYGGFPGWAQLNNHIHGMADQSGRYQDWMATPIADREPFLYNTPDTRYPQGSTVAEQQQNPGTYFLVPVAPAVAVAFASTLGDQWAQPGRGTWRWSYYRDYRRDLWLAAGYIGSLPEIAHREMRLLAAEAHYRLGNAGEAVSIIDETRTQHGLGTAAANADCVPRLPDNTCGGILEALKWEKRNELRFPGQGWVVYYDNRGWGDLPEGTFLHLPIPSRELTLLGLPQYTFGGVGGEGAAPRGAYGF